MHGKYTFTASDIKNVRLYLSTRTGDGTGGQYPDDVNTSNKKRKFRLFLKQNSFFLKDRDLMKKTVTYLDEKGKIINAKKAQSILKNANSNNKDILAKRESNQVVVAEEELEDIFDKYHVKNGHYGINATRDAINKDYYIKKCTEFVTDKIADCIKCIQLNKKPQKKYASPLHLKPVPQEPMSKFQADLCGPFTKS